MSNSVWILILATIFWFIETKYFGWNLSPQSPAEVVCDGLVALMACLSILARPQ